MSRRAEILRRSELKGVTDALFDVLTDIEVDVALDALERV
jgi:hypothetical protein